MKEVFLKDAQSTLQKTITWSKKSIKGRQEWEVVYGEANLLPRKLKTPMKTEFASKFIFSQKTLEYACATMICYNCQFLHLQVYVLSSPTLAIARAVIEILNPIVKQCVLNYTRGDWLSFDALLL
jgi:hypothetical protein